MQPMTVLVVDDDRSNRAALEAVLAQVEDIETILAHSGQRALEYLLQREVHLILLDVQMPGLSGVELVSLLRNYKNPPAVVFVTAFDRYAVEAFDLEAIDYLVKPVDEARLDQTIRRVQRLAGGAEGTSDTFATLTCRVGRKTYTINRDDVVVVEAAGDLVRLWTEDGESHLVRESISSLTAAWSPNGFLRIHRSYLVRAASMASVCASRSAFCW